MISQDQIKTLSNKYQTTELNIRREYFQHLFLSYFYQQPPSSQVYFKGGTALHLLYKSPRFSEDLDFSASISSKQIEESLLHALTQIERGNIKVKLQESKITSGGYLTILVFQEILLSLQISLREKSADGQVATIVNDFVPSYTVVSLTNEQLVDEKIQALFARQKPRDFYDLYFMLRANLISPEKRGVLAGVLELLKKVEINFEHELKQFLPKAHWAIIKNFKVVLEQELKIFT